MSFGEYRFDAARLWARPRRMAQAEMQVEALRLAANGPIAPPVKVEVLRFPEDERAAEALACRANRQKLAAQAEELLDGDVSQRIATELLRSCKACRRCFAL